jgi:hypothetical protein
MKLTTKVDFERFERSLERTASRLTTAANRAVEEVTLTIKTEGRRMISAALSNQASRLLTHEFYRNDEGGDVQVVGFIHSRWFRSASGKITKASSSATGTLYGDILGAHARPGGTTINPKKPGGFLYIPLNKGNKRRNNRFRLSFQDENVTLIRRKGGGYLVIDRGPSPFAAGTGKRGRRKKIGRVVAVLVKSVYLPQRLDFDPLRAKAKRMLATRITAIFGRPTGAP